MDANDALRRYELQMLVDSARNTLDLIAALDRFNAMHSGSSMCGDDGHPNRACAALRAEIDDRIARFQAEEHVPPERWWP